MCNAEVYAVPIPQVVAVNRVVFVVLVQVSLRAVLRVDHAVETLVSYDLPSRSYINPTYCDLTRLRRWGTLRKRHLHF